MPLILFILFSTFVYAGPCGPHKIYIREQFIDSYHKNDGTDVSAHIRNSHCRELTRTNYFQDSTNQKFKNVKTNIKKWTPSEKKIIFDLLDKIPAWLKKYLVAETLRADSDGTQNPASSVALSKTLVIFDTFFKSAEKTQILAHELAHLTILDLTRKELEDFYLASGWTINRAKGIKLPPKVLVMPDSVESVVEDYANHVEMFHYKPIELKRLNPKSYLVIEAIIKMRGHK